MNIDLNMKLYNVGLCLCIFIRFICYLDGVILDQVLKMKLMVTGVNVNACHDNR
jgi:hypothetical protein